MLRTYRVDAPHEWCGGLNTLLYIDDKGTNYLQIQKKGCIFVAVTQAQPLRSILMGTP